MTISDLLVLPGGLGLFLYGMNLLQETLEKMTSGKLAEILQRAAATPVRGFVTGTVFTAILQSSSAVTVLLVGMTEAGILSLQQATGIILGSNIGTTVTGQLTAFRFNDCAPFLAFVGVGIFLFCKREKGKQIGSMITGIGFLFTGLAMMEYAMKPLQEMGWIQELLENCHNPMLGIGIGAVFTALIQSSSASVGILQTMAQWGLVDIQQSMYIVFGQNIGTCVTALLASLGNGDTAKRTALLHLFINVLGTVIFLGLCSILPFGEIIEKMTPQEPARQIANIHLLFNLVTSLLFLPFTKQLVEITGWLIKQKQVKTNTF